MSILQKTQQQFLQNYMKSVKAWEINITNSVQGLRLYDELLKPAEGQHPILCKIYKTKLEAAKQLENILGGSGHRAYIAEIEGNTTFSRTYVFSCDRQMLSSRTYTFTFECAYTSADDPMPVGESNVGSPHHNAAGTVTGVIYPKPLALNIIAVISSLLGAALKLALDASAKATSVSMAKPGTAGDPLPVVAAITQSLTNGTALAAAITALFFFNIYGSTEIGKRINAGTDWRSALIIGGISGLVNDRVVQAIRGLLG